MNRWCSFILVFVLAVATTVVSAEEAQERERDGSVLAKVRENMLRLEIRFGPGDRRVGEGSAFFISDRGHAVTCFHVIDGAHSASASFVDGNESFPVSICYIDPSRDLAIIKVALPPTVKRQGLTFLMQEPVEGAEAWACGFPLGLGYTVTRGAVNGLRQVDKLPDALKRELSTLRPSLRLIQHDCAINPGNSGGPIVDRDGNVVGINSFFLVRAQNVYFSIWIGEALDGLKSLDSTMTFEQMRQAVDNRSRGAASEAAVVPRRDPMDIDVDSIRPYVAERAVSAEQLRASLVNLRSAFPHRCPRCAGEGVVTIKKVEGVIPYQRVWVEKDRCTACGGSGVFVGPADRMKRSVRSVAPLLSGIEFGGLTALQALRKQYTQFLVEQGTHPLVPFGDIIDDSMPFSPAKHQVFVGVGVVARAVKTGNRFSYVVSCMDNEILIVNSSIEGSVVVGRPVFFAGVWSEPSMRLNGQSIQTLKGAFISQLRQ